MLQNVTRLCHTKSIVTVNGKFPGPRIVAREGDRLLIKVVNHVQNNISIHWYIYMDWPPSIFSKYSEPYIEKAESKSLSTISLIQAWNSAASKWVGWWTGVHNSVPYTNWTELCVQLHHRRTKRHSLVACSYIMAKINSLRSTYHSSQTRHYLSIC
jgi:hypothetical protein